MVKILALLLVLQEETVEKVKDIIEQDVWGTIKEWLGFELISVGKEPNHIGFTVGHLIILIIAFILTSILLKWIRVLMTRKMEGDDKLKFVSVFKFIKYIAYIVVVLATMSASGINITVLLTASAALFVGLGLALQEVFQDVIGGILIMIDKSISAGDIIEMDGRVGRVFEIKLRTTRALTRDDKVIIIPNHKFITDTVYNYTQNHKTTRENVKVGVAYGSDTRQVEKILLECAVAHPEILKHPKPFALFENFGDSSLDFGLYFFVRDSFVDPRIKSALRYAIDDRFRESGITIPFPQRDVHLFNTANPVYTPNKTAVNTNIEPPKNDMIDE
ncbi:mechanosensitive ion channel-like protein [Dokdonia sp. Hel_I_63]|jgi:small-conductance mechanosensitive channel|uniref:mechanosensitive ion channel family protein n=1 Tax=unclassified Dokdonia TaxID=2615033 RepID=UPI00020A62D2|nr:MULTISPECIES: mechanosensitive ion channel domain-containing protein [unclassified Dokdonia]AEE20003.1 MscS Mechanosensitive ion channel [Dokdonia sp. 4H-3-7-5]TVZ23743.1 mechanosensitive ion channel-like protein [Dokdonia sp. Hel_I_63]|tara:strand:+ start:11389 stop:12384 length:996 start_codon:yes stop_codon:yes gene_type:complete